LRRKTSVGKADHQARAMSLPKALRVSLAKVADELCEMAMAVIGVRRQTCKATDLAALFEEQSLLVLLDGTLQRRGAAVFDPSFVGGLIQQQTMGKVLPVPTEGTRQSTATDAAMCAPFLDALLERAAKLPEDKAQRQLIEGYRFGAHTEEARLLMMALEQPEYEVFHLTIDMSCGARQGQITLCFPAAQMEARGGTVGQDAGQAEMPRQERPQMERTVMALTVELNIALARVRMPLSELQGLRVDDLLELGVSSFDKSIVQTRDGQRLSRGKLGQINGVRAMQLEHATTALTAPRRRVSDRDTLDLPRVTGDGTGTKAPRIEEVKQLPLVAASDLGVDALQSVEMTEEAVMAQVSEGGGTAMSDDLPDMSDLPDFEEESSSQAMSIT
jgi:flagellar motor switch/type III secretory pathway protein FliN